MNIRRPGLLAGTWAALCCVMASPAWAETAPVPTGGLPLEALPTQTLASGQCGLFLWARTSPPRRVFMALQDPAMARIRIEGRSVDLPRTAAEGESAYGHTPMQRYEGEGIVLTMRIEMDARSGLVGGAVIPTGSLEYRDAKGWETIIPVAGMVGCQP